MEVPWGRERLRIDVLREDVVRIKISRGGVFDETPTLAVVNDGGADFEVDGTTLRTAALEVDIETLDVRRADGTPVIESIEPYGTLNDAFWVRRKCRAEDAIYGLGEKTGRHNRRGRSFTLWNTDILNPHANAPFGGDGTEVDFDPYYVSIPFFHHHTADGQVAASFVDNGYRASVRLQQARRVLASASRAASTPSTSSPARRCQASSRPTRGSPAARPRRRCGRSAITSAAGRRTRRPTSRRSARRHRELDIPCDALWLDIEYMDGYRVFTWNTELFPDAPGMLARLREQGFRVITIIDPGVKHEPGYAVFDQALERDVLCRTEGGDIYIGEVWPGDTAFPDFVTEDGRRWWGELNAAHVQSGLAGIWNDMNEPATGAMPPERMRFDRGQRLARALAQPVRAADGDGHPRRPAGGDARAAHVHPLARRVRRHPALRRQLDGRQPGALGPPVAEHPDGQRLRALRPAVRRRRRRRLRTGTPTPSCSCAGCSTAR